MVNGSTPTPAEAPESVDWTQHDPWCIGEHGPRGCERVVRYVAFTGINEPMFTKTGALLPTATVSIFAYPASDPGDEPGWLRLRIVDPSDPGKPCVDLCMTSSEADELGIGLDRAISLFRGTEVDEETASIRARMDGEAEWRLRSA